MSRLPSFFTVSSGNAQLLQNVLIPRACNTSYNNRTYWGARADLSNIGTLYADSIVACNFSGGTAGVIGDRTTGVAIAGDGSDVGTYTTKLNVTGFGTVVLGGNGLSTQPHGPVSNVVAVGSYALNLGSNIQKSVLIGTDAGYTASNVGSTVAIGDRTLFVGSGSNNVYLGTSNGYSNLGSGNVFLGSMVGTTETATDNTLYIGNQLGVLLHGNFATGQLGVNCDPASNFDVSGTTQLRGTTTITASLGVNTTTPSTTLDVSGTSTFRGVTIVNSNFGVNITPASTLDVSGTTRLRGNVIIDGDLTVSGGPIGSDVCTGQVILGIGASSSNYESLIAVKGGIQLSDGFIQLNRMDARDTVYRLDVSASARIAGGSLVGGVTLSGTNLTTTGNVSISGNFSNIATSTNSIGGLTISSGNLVTSGTISGTFVNGTTSVNSIGGLTISSGNLVTSGTISGLFWNASNTNNSIGGVTLGPNGVFTASFGVISNATTTNNFIGGIRLSNGVLSNGSNTSNTLGYLTIGGDASSNILGWTHALWVNSNVNGNNQGIGTASGTYNTIGGVTLYAGQALGSILGGRLLPTYSEFGTPPPSGTFTSDLIYNNVEQGAGVVVYYDEGSGSPGKVTIVWIKCGTLSVISKLTQNGADITFAGDGPGQAGRMTISPVRRSAYTIKVYSFHYNIGETI